MATQEMIGMPLKTYRNKVTDLLRMARLNAVAARWSRAETVLPDWIRRDIGLSDGPAEQPQRRMRWHDLNM